jgi:hypothetical protein
VLAVTVARRPSRRVSTSVVTTLCTIERTSACAWRAANAQGAVPRCASMCCAGDAFRYTALERGGPTLVCAVSHGNSRDSAGLHVSTNDVFSVGCPFISVAVRIKPLWPARGSWTSNAARDVITNCGTNATDNRLTATETTQPSICRHGVNFVFSVGGPFGFRWSPYQNRYGRLEAVGLQVPLGTSYRTVERMQRTTD